MHCEIHEDAKIGENVSLGHGVRVYGNVEIGDNCTIGDFCVIGHPTVKAGSPPLRLGQGAIIRSHAVLYEGSDIGPYLETGHHVVIREGADIGENLRVGNFSDIEGACRIGDFVRLHGYAHVGRGSDIGDFVWLFSLTTLMNDPLPPSHLDAPVTIGDMTTVCVNAQLMPGAQLGRGSFVASGAVASGEVPAGAIISGPDGEVAGQVRFLMHMESRTRHPWHKHFADAYPERARDRIKALGAEIDEEIARQNGS
ncbi:MAG: acyl-ACP--UDP-N-acetylglucosamine O-acyltransferase [Alphaproteobacteria bacterium]